MKNTIRKTLDVYLNNLLVGKLHQKQSGSLSFAYEIDFLHQAQTGISLSLPLREQAFEGDVPKAFFSGFLPEESVRRRLAQYLGLSDKNSFALLEVIGGECAGALSLYPEGQIPAVQAKQDEEVLDEIKLKEILELIKRRPLLVGENNIRLSLAGAQDKLAVGFQNGKISLIKGTRPTTHILKPLIEHITDSVYNELFCMRLAKKIGFAVPQAEVFFVENTPCFIVERYDREKIADGTIVRIHQEDFCQALGILPEVKYEREGGPSIAVCQQILSKYSARPAIDHIHLLEIIIFNYLIGNADAHGKNFSLLYKVAKPQLAPAYDLLSTAIYPHLSEKMAMKIGGKYKPQEVLRRHWLRIVPDTQAAKSNLESLLLKISSQTLEQAFILKEKLHQDGLRSCVFSEICQLIQNRAKKIHSLLH